MSIQNTGIMYSTSLPMGTFGSYPKSPTPIQAINRNSPYPHSLTFIENQSHPNHDLNVLPLNTLQHGLRGFQGFGLSKPNIRRKERETLRGLLHTNNVIQVCGPPLVGKSHLVIEAINEVKNKPEGESIIEHHISCKGLTSFASILATLFMELHIPESPNKQKPVFQIMATLEQWLPCHHIFVFHKCEAIKRNKEHFYFIDFLFQLMAMPNSTLIFTTYKLFPHQSNLHTLEIGMLYTVSDIHALLNFYSWNNDLEPGYSNLIVRYNLCFPIAIRYFAQTYLQGPVIPRSEEIEKEFEKKSVAFLESCLNDHLEELPKWLDIDQLKWVTFFCKELDGTFSEELLWTIISDKTSQDSRWNQTMTHLKENFAMCIHPGSHHLRFHPLVLLYFYKALQAGTIVLRGQWFDNSCNKVVKFLCGVMEKAEVLSRFKGNKFATLQCLLPQWTNMKNMIQMAIYRQDYKVYWKVATRAANILIKWSPNEATEFYQAMYENCRLNGFRSRRETAFLEGCLAYSLAQGRGTSQDGK